MPHSSKRLGPSFAMATAGKAQKFPVCLVRRECNHPRLQIAWKLLPRPLLRRRGVFLRECCPVRVQPPPLANSPPSQYPPLKLWLLKKATAGETWKLLPRPLLRWSGVSLRGYCDKLRINLAHRGLRECVPRECAMVRPFDKLRINLAHHDTSSFLFSFTYPSNPVARRRG